MKTKMHSYSDAYLAFSKIEGQKSKLYAGESSVYYTTAGDKKIIRLFDVEMNFTYSITYEEEKTIITITNETGVIIRMQ